MRLTAEQALPMLAEALAGNPLFTIEALAHEVSTSPRAFIWAGERSCVFVRITDGAARVAECAPAAGDLEEILSVGREEIESLARSVGASQMLIQAGRLGWERALKPHGYEAEAVILRKML